MASPPKYPAPENGSLSHPPPKAPRSYRRLENLPLPAIPSLPADAGAYTAPGAAIYDVSLPSSSRSNDLPREQRSYTKTPSLAIPVIPPPPPNADVYRVPGFVSSLPLPTSTDPTAFSHLQSRLRGPTRSADEKHAQDLDAKFAAMERVLSDLKPFASLGDFLAILFFNRAHGKSDLRGVTHAKSVAKFLSGHSQIKWRTFSLSFTSIGMAAEESAQLALEIEAEK
ncbi:hypothetical protein DFH09DRAFT_1078307 [Mycena vulgaris]|nr:hypothetical protein DFH09DRAFT_1078307 [Mycena vulgaris]